VSETELELETREKKKRLKTLDVHLKKRGEKGIEVEAMG
jgi:hypothetical protein